MKKAFDANVPRPKVRYRMEFPPDFVERRHKKDSATVAVSRMVTEAGEARAASAPISQDSVSSFPEGDSAVEAALTVEALRALSQDEIRALVQSDDGLGKKLASGPGMSDKVVVAQHSRGTTSPSRRPPGERKSVLPEIPDPSEADPNSDAYAQVESGSPSPAETTESDEAQANAIERISLLERELSKLKTMDLSLEGPVQAAKHQAERASDDALARMDEARRISIEMEEKARVLTDLSRELANLQAQKDQVLISLEESHRNLVESLADEESTAKELAEILAGIRRLTSIIARLASMPVNAPLPSTPSREDSSTESEGRSPRQ